MRTGNDVIVTKGPRTEQEGVIEFGCFAGASFSVRFANGETEVIAKNGKGFCEHYENCCLACRRTEAELKSIGLILVPDHVIPPHRRSFESTQ